MMKLEKILIKKKFKTTKITRQTHEIGHKTKTTTKKNKLQ